MKKQGDKPKFKKGDRVNPVGKDFLKYLGTGTIARVLKNRHRRTCEWLYNVWFRFEFHYHKRLYMTFRESELKKID